MTDNPQSESGHESSTSRSLYTAWVIAVVMLGIAVVGESTSSFYVLLRWVCCAMFVWTAVAFFRRAHIIMVLILGALAALFNPAVPVHLGRSVWVLVDCFSLLLIIALIWGQFDSERRKARDEEKKKLREMAAKLTPEGELGWRWNGREWRVVKKTEYTPAQQQEVALRITEYGRYMTEVSELSPEWTKDFANLLPPEREKEYSESLPDDQRERRRLRGLRPFVSARRFKWERAQQYLILGAVVVVLLVAITECHLFQ